MQTSVIGFPRIGTLRELKFASEKYFRKEIDSYAVCRNRTRFYRGQENLQFDCNIWISTG